MQFWRWMRITKPKPIPAESGQKKARERSSRRTQNRSSRSSSPLPLDHSSSYSYNSPDYSLIFAQCKLKWKTVSTMLGLMTKIQPKTHSRLDDGKASPPAWATLVSWPVSPTSRMFRFSTCCISLSFRSPRPIMVPKTDAQVTLFLIIPKSKFD